MNRKFIFIIIILGIVLYFFSCGDMDETYKEFIVPGGVIYPGKVESPVIRPGKDKIMLEWLKGNDPKVTATTIYWNNYLDTLVVPIAADDDTIRRIITPLPENTYTFIFFTNDDEGNISIPVELTGSSYGAVYQSSLNNRAITEEYVTAEDGVWTIVWGRRDVTNGMWGAELTYTTEDNKTQTIISTGDTTKITGHLAESQWKYRTLFLPTPLAIDTFYVDFADVRNIPVKDPFIISTDGWIATAEHWAPNQGLNGDNGEEGAIPAKTIDGDVASFWHTAHNAEGMSDEGPVTAATDYPHWLKYDMGQERDDIFMVELTPRNSYADQSIKDFQIQGSLDGNTWTTYGSFSLQAVNGLAQRFELNQNLDNINMRYIRIWMLNAHNNGQHAHLAEFAVYRK